MHTLLSVDEDLIGSIVVIPAIVLPESGVPVAKVSKAAPHSSTLGQNSHVARLVCRQLPIFATFLVCESAIGKRTILGA